MLWDFAGIYTRLDTKQHFYQCFGSKYKITVAKITGNRNSGGIVTNNSRATRVIWIV